MPFLLQMTFYNCQEPATEHGNKGRVGAYEDGGGHWKEFTAGEAEWNL